MPAAALLLLCSCMPWRAGESDGTPQPVRGTVTTLPGSVGGAGCAAAFDQYLACYQRSGAVIRATDDEIDEMIEDQCDIMDDYGYREAFWECFGRFVRWSCTNESAVSQSFEVAFEACQSYVEEPDYGDTAVVYD
jgi:hypothetical protein